MRILVFSTDRKILDTESTVFKRQQAYATHFDTYTILIGSREKLISGPVELAPGSLALPFSWGAATRAAREADVISAQDPFEVGLGALLFALLHRKPFHVQVHTNLFSKEFGAEGWGNRLRRIIARFVLRRADRIRVVSEDIADALKAWRVKAPVTILPIFVDVKKYEQLERKKHPEWKIALLSVGRLEREKRFEKSIDTVAQLQARGHDAGLTIVGSGGEEEELREHAQMLHVDRFVKFAGEQPDIRPFLAEADLVLVPSRYEGYGLVIIEALAAGVPVLATDVGIAREAGAMVVTFEEFTDAAERWVSSGPRQASLQGYPYGDLHEYVKRYCADIALTPKAKMGS